MRTKVDRMTFEQELESRLTSAPVADRNRLIREALRADVDQARYRRGSIRLQWSFYLVRRDAGYLQALRDGLTADTSLMYYGRADALDNLAIYTKGI